MAKRTMMLAAMSMRGNIPLTGKEGAQTVQFSRKDERTGNLPVDFDAGSKVDVTDFPEGVIKYLMNDRKVLVEGSEEVEETVDTEAAADVNANDQGSTEVSEGAAEGDKSELNAETVAGAGSVNEGDADALS